MTQAITARFAADNARQIQELANKNKWSVSATINHLVEIGLKVTNINLEK